jgi:tellurite methyltransferase
VSDATPSHSAQSPPSAWLIDNLEAVREGARIGPVLDLACGRGRNALGLSEQGLEIIGMDRNRDHLRELGTLARRRGQVVPSVRTDLETCHGIPVRRESCGVVLVFRFLFRPLAAAIEDALRPGGILVYETFAEAQRTTGRGPRCADFYLGRNELPGLFPGLEVLAYEEGPIPGPELEFTSRLLARKPTRPAS